MRADLLELVANPRVFCFSFDTGNQPAQLIFGTSRESFDFIVGRSCPCNPLFERDHLRNEKSLKQIAEVIEFPYGGLLVTFSGNQLVAVDRLQVCRASFTKSAENASNFPELIRRGGAFRIQHETIEPKPIVFGTPISTGPCAMTVDQAEFENLEVTIDAFQKAGIGDSVPIKIKPLVPVRFELLKPESGVELSALVE